MKKLIICIVLTLTSFTATFAQKGLLWEISGKGMKKPAYLFGTIHMYDTTAYQTPQAPIDILNKVNKVYFEIDLGHIDQAEMMAGLFIKDTAQYLDKLLDAKSLAKLDSLAARSAMLKMLGNRIYTIKPFLLASMLMAGDTPPTSIEAELYKAAIAKNDSVGGIETMKEQMAAVDAVSIPGQANMLRDMLNNYMPPAEIIRKLTDAYVKQDADNILSTLNDNLPVDVNFDKSIRSERNYVMADRIDSLLRKESPLIAVGAGHLGSDDGIIALLQKKGYKLKNIPFTIKKLK